MTHRLHACLETNELIPALRPFPRPPSINLRVKKAQQSLKREIPTEQKDLCREPPVLTSWAEPKSDSSVPHGLSSRWDCRLFLPACPGRGGCTARDAAPRGSRPAAGQLTTTSLFPYKVPLGIFWQIPISAIASCPSEALTDILTSPPTQTL